MAKQFAWKLKNKMDMRFTQCEELLRVKRSYHSLRSFWELKDKCFVKSHKTQCNM